MEAMVGARANSRRCAPAQSGASVTDYTPTDTFEAQITKLFLPWLADDVPDGTWQTLQKNLGCIVRGIQRAGQIDRGMK